MNVQKFQLCLEQTSINFYFIYFSINHSSLISLISFLLTVRIFEFQLYRNFKKIWWNNKKRKRFRSSVKNDIPNLSKPLAKSINNIDSKMILSSYLTGSSKPTKFLSKNLKKSFNPKKSVSDFSRLICFLHANSYPNLNVLSLLTFRADESSNFVLVSSSFSLTAFN